MTKSLPEYRVTQFVADLARLRRLDGIAYQSSQALPGNPEARGQNLVLFTAAPGTREQASEPRRYVWRGVVPATIMDPSLVRLDETH